jgi:anaerobic glycerol-3-phosphate dehydrogenase C subunit
MDQERARIQADLSGQLDGDIHCDDAFLHIYSSDASIHELRPMGVVRPVNVSDVQATVNYARENQIPIHPRGAGSNVIGGCVGEGLIIDFSYAMRKTLQIGRGIVTVQPGVVLADLNRQLRSHNQMFGPDPATRSVTTLGGVLSLNRSGSHWAKYGEPRDKVIALQVVLPSGEVVELSAAKSPIQNANGHAPSALANRVSQLIDRRQEVIDAHRPNVNQNQAGYNVFDLHHNHEIDLTRLLVGSEGTLGIITQATIETEPIPRHRGVALLFFDRLEKAATAAVEISKMGVAACDLMDRRLLSLARESNEQLRRLIPAQAEAMILAEHQSPDNVGLTDKLQLLSTRILRKKKLAFDVQVATNTIERNLFWRLTRRVVPTLYRLRGFRRALPFVEDIAVEPAKLPKLLSAVHEILNKHEITASIFCHAPQGVIHIRPFMDLAGEKEKLRKIAGMIFDQVVELNGSISGGCGDGLNRTWYLRKQYGKLYSVFREVKNIFDPQNLLNPGKVIDTPPRDLLGQVRKIEAKDLEQAAEEASTELIKKPLPVIEPQLDWAVEDIALATRNCNGCARCRTASPEERMCPIFRNGPREEASPRAKANIMRAIATGSLPVSELAKDEVKAIADLCVNCHQCRVECPASVDIPKLMVEAKAQYISINGLKLSDWLLVRLDLLYEFAGKMPRLTNLLIRNRFSRWILDRLFGIAEGRKLPRFATRTFQRWASKNSLTKSSKQSGRKVAYFVDAFVNWNDPELGQAFIKILQHNGVEVMVPPNQEVSGMSLISDGAVNRAKKLAQRNIEQFAELVRQGFTVVTTESSAALALSHEYRYLVDDTESQLLADNTVDACSFLMQMHQAGELELDFNPVNSNIGYHLPCHQKALGRGAPALQLLQLIPSLHVEMIEKGCSGMAGTFGLKRKNYRRSLRTGFSLIDAMRSPTIVAGTTECSTCKIQMEQGTRKPTVHPIKILALAYGLIPELDDLFERRSEELVISS